MNQSLEYKIAEWKNGSSTTSVHEASLAAVRDHFALLAKLAQGQMKQGQDYGVIPGTTKPTLLKPGADKLCRMFGLYPTFEVLTAIEAFTHPEFPLLHYRYRCELFRFESGLKVGEGIGSCNSWEKKYRWRKSDRICPDCGSNSIRKSKDQPEWYCWRKIGGCGAMFEIDDDRITEQEEGLIPNADICDQINTIDKMAQKRAYIGAVILAVNASEFFTQDLEDLYSEAVSDITSDIFEEIKRVGWNREAARAFLAKTYPKTYKGRVDKLPEHQLREFLSYLQALPDAA